MTFPGPSASFRAESVTDGLPVPQRYWAILALGLAIMVAVLEGSIATIALPAISQDLHASAMDSIWVVNSYQVAIVLTLLPISSLGEILGYRLVYCWGLVAFAVGSIACMFAPTLPVLAVSRFCQGLGAAGIMGVNSALLRFIFPRAMLARGGLAPRSHAALAAHDRHGSRRGPTGSFATSAGAFGRSCHSTFFAYPFFGSPTQAQCWLSGRL
jgi:MFS family permease